MIHIPYKLDLYWTWNLSENKSENKSQNYKFNNLSDNNKKDQITNDNKTIYLNNYEFDIIKKNKLKERIINMRETEIGWIISKKNTGFLFEFEVTNKNRINKENYYEYTLKNGILGILNIGSTEKINKYINNDIEQLVFNIIDWDISSIDLFIIKWNNDKIKYKNNIPEIYFYGTIYDNNNKFLSYYYITKKYQTYEDVIKMDFNFIINYFKKILLFLDSIKSFNYIFRNLNMISLGFDYNIDKSDIDVKIIKYTNTTLLSLNDVFFEKFKLTKCFNKSCVGNIIPYYIIDDYYNLENNWLSRLDKYYSLPLVEIIFVLFYNNDNTLNKLYNYIIEPSKLESRLQYFHIYNRYNISNNNHILTNLVNNLKIRFCNINPLFEYTMETIILNLLNKEYNKILYPNHILVIIKKIEESNEEFNIKYYNKNNIYNPNKENYLKISNENKKNIIANDSLINLNKIKEINNYRDIEPIYNLSNEYPNIKIILKNNINYKNLYLKYKIKYINLKKNISK